MLVWSRELTAFASNCYIIACPETREAAIIDPGAPDPWIRRVLAEQGLKLSAVWLTHGHVDHIGGVEWVKSFSGAPVAIHPDDEPMLGDPRLNGSALFLSEPISTSADRLINDGDVLPLGNLRFRVIHTPGHSPGGVCFYLESGGHLIAGDTLFAGSIGRTDLPGGSHSALIRAIREKLLPLPAETVVYPGHGPTTTIGDEKEYNPFL